MNNVTLVGRLTADPDLKTTPGTGTEYANFTLAVDRRYRDANGQKQTDFIYCKAWRQTAVFLQTYFNKGDGLVLNGRIETRRYEDKNGDTRTAFEVVAENVEFAPGKGQGGGAAVPATNPPPLAFAGISGTPAAKEQASADVDMIVDDDLPF